MPDGVRVGLYVGERAHSLVSRDVPLLYQFADTGM